MYIRKFTIHYLVLLIFCLTLSACGNFYPISEKTVQATATGDTFPHNGSVQSDDQEVLVASLELPVSLPSNEPVILNFTLQNHSDKALYFLKWYTPLEGISGKIFRIECDGQPISYEGILAMRAAPSAEDYIFMEPGESVSAEVNLSNAYDFSEPGKYTIAFLSPNISHIAYSETEMAKSVDELFPVNISTKEKVVEIVDVANSSR